MTKQPKVSIVVPTYGVEKYLRQCIDSILAQTLKDIEIILVDDGGKDSCPRIIDEYAAQDNRIKVIHKPNGGYGSACNAGLNIATGKYVAIFEPDDFIKPHMYETLYKMAIEHDVDIVKSNFLYYFDLSDNTKFYSENRWYGSKHSKYKIPNGIFTISDHPEFFFFHPSIWTCIYKRDFLEKHNIRVEEIPGAGWTDNLFQVQTLNLANKIYYTDEHLYNWRCRNKDDAKDLKDITIPALRTKTIHKWLRKNQITDPGIWACLYKRELAYLHIIARAAPKEKIQENLLLIQEMIADIDPEILNNSAYASRREKRILKEMQHDFLKYYNWYKCKLFIKKLFHFRRSILCIHWQSKLSPSEQENFFVILGIMFYRHRPNMDIKCFTKIKI